MEIITIQKANLKKILNALKQGKTIIFPTDTVYGLICDATNKKAVNKIFKIKKREKSKPLPIFIKDIKTAKKFAFVDKKQEKILKGKWPGKFTFILKRRKTKIFGVAKNTIALRIPDYKLLNPLLKKINKPLIATSANISGQPATTKIKEVLKQFKKQKIQPDLVIDTGNLPKSKPSKVIDLTGKKPRVLRY